MDNTFPRKDDKVFALQCVATLPIVAIVLFSLGAVQFTRHHQYRNVATGNQIGIHVDAGRDGFGKRYYHLVEKYHMPENGFNCSIANLYEGRAEAENDMARHVTGHAQLNLHFHGSNCITVSDWTTHRITAIAMFVIASVALALAACCLPTALHEPFMEAPERAGVDPANAERRRPAAVQMTELYASATPFTGNQAGYTQACTEEPHHSYNSSSGPYTTSEQYSERDRQLYAAGFQEMRGVAQEQLDRLSRECRGREPRGLPPAVAGAAV
jgi:hypothetical protein